SATRPQRRGLAQDGVLTGALDPGRGPGRDPVAGPEESAEHRTGIRGDPAGGRHRLEHLDGPRSVMGVPERPAADLDGVGLTGTRRGWGATRVACDRLHAPE